MITADGKLEIFERFVPDETLAKRRDATHQRWMHDLIEGIVAGKADEQQNEAMVTNTTFVATHPFRGHIMLTPGREMVVSNGIAMDWVRLPWWRRLLLRLGLGPNWRQLVGAVGDTDVAPVPVPTPQPTLSIEEFFRSVRGSALEIQVVETRAKSYERAITVARQAGQRALVERLAQAIDIVRAEAHLVDLGLRTVVTEAQLVEFARKSPRGLRLEWVRNFVRPIPDDLVARKIRCDDRLVFDAYVVLHYDPDAKGRALTKAEEEARKDPILFGLIEGSRKLYFVGDWVDTYCDLTLETLIETLGQDAIDANELTAGKDVDASA